MRIASNPVTEGYVEAILDPEAHMAELRAGDPASAYADTIAARAGEVNAAERASIGRARADLEENGGPSRPIAGSDWTRRSACSRRAARSGRRARPRAG